MKNTTMTRWAGWMMVGIGVLHTAVFVPHPHWASWLAGDLRTGAAGHDSVATFWALPGGFAVVLVVLGLLVVRFGRNGETVPGHVGYATGGWALLCVLLIGPSGFLLGLVPAALLIVVDLRERKNASRSKPRDGAPAGRRRHTGFLQR